MQIFASSALSAGILVFVYVGLRMTDAQDTLFTTSSVPPKEAPALVSATAVSSGLLSQEAMQDWVKSVVEQASEKQPAPQVTQVVRTIYSVAPAPAPVQAPAPVINNYYPATTRYVPEPVYVQAPAASVQTQVSLGTNANLDGTLSVAGLIDASGGLDLAGNLLSDGGLSFGLPSVSDTLVGLSSADTLVNKTISAADNTITGLTSLNFADPDISAWTNDAGYVAEDTIATLTNKTISGLDNVFTDIPNSATTASALDTVGSIVTRDGSGDFSAGTITADLLGNASTATTAAEATVADTATLASSVVNGLYSTGTYNNPTWLTSVDGSKLIGVVTADAIASGDYAIDISGTAANALNAATATLAATASSVTNGLYSTGSYTDPAWLTSLSGSKLIGTVTADAIASGSYAISVTGNAATATTANLADAVTNGVYTTGSYIDPSWITSINGSKLTGTITANALAAGTYGINVTGNAATATLASTASAVTNGLYSTGNYANPSWLTSLDGSKLIGTITADALASGAYAVNITGNAATASTANIASTVTNGIYTTGTYVNPSWLTSIDGSKLTGVVTADAIASGSYAIDILGNALSATNASTVTNGLYSTSSYTDPSWLTSLSGSKLVGTVTANAITAGTYGINVTGNAATATLASTASAVTNGLYSTGSYVNPTWLSSIDGGKLTGIVTANAIASGAYAISVTGNAATATLASTVTNGLYSTGSYSNPSWLTGLDGSKLTGTVTASALAAGTYAVGITGNAGTVTNGLYSTGSYTNPSWLTSLDGSKLTGTVTASALAAGTYGISITGNAATSTLASTATIASTVTNGIYTTGTYANPTWLTSIDGSKLTGTVTASAIAAGTYGINVTGNAATATLATTASAVTNGLYSTGSYTDPSWITSLSGSKLAGTVTASALAAGTYAIGITGNAGTVTNGLYSTGTYSNPSWLTSVDGSKLTGTITANALTATDYAVNNLTAANTAAVTGTLANTLLSGGCVVNVNALSLAAFQSTATITTSQIFYNSTRGKHSRITSVSTCVDASSNKWSILTLTDAVTGSVAGDSFTIYTPAGSIGNTAAGFFNNFYAINLKGLVSTLTGGFDVAEEYPTADTSLSPGDVVSLDTANAGDVERSSGAYDANVIGIITTDPGLTLGDETQGTWAKVALTGRVPIKVSTENGDISIGDPLTASSVPGVAMKATKAGDIVGKAMDNYSGTGVGTIPAFVSLGYWGGASDAVDQAALVTAAEDGAVSIDAKVIFNGGLVTDSIGSDSGALKVLSDITFVGRPYFSTDTAGFALVREGQDSVHVAYADAYEETPVVTASIAEAAADTDPTAVIGTQYAVTGSDQHGFTIQLSQPAQQDIRFSWIAIAVKGAVTTEDMSSASSQTPLAETVTDTDPTATPAATVAGGSDATATSTPDIGTTTLAPSTPDDTVASSPPPDVTPADALATTSDDQTPN